MQKPDFSSFFWQLFFRCIGYLSLSALIGFVVGQIVYGTR